MKKFFSLLFLLSLTAPVLASDGMGNQDVRLKTTSSGILQNVVSSGSSKGGSSQTLNPAQISALGWWDLRYSTLHEAKECTGAAPADAGLLGCVEDLTSNNHDLAANADAARTTYNLFLDYTNLPVTSGSGSTRLTNTSMGAALSGTQKTFTVFAMVALDAETVQNQITFAMANSGSTNTLVQCRLDAGLNTTANRPIMRSFRRTDAGVSVTADTGAGWGGAGLKVLAYVYDGTNMSFYQNGNLATTASAGVGAATITHFTWGQSWDGTNAIGSGPNMIGGAVWDRVLSASEIQQMFKYFMGTLQLPYSSSSDEKITVCLGDSHAHRNEATQNYRHWFRLMDRNGTLNAKEVKRIVNRAVSGAQVVGGSAPDLTEQWNDFKANFRSGDLMVAISGGNDTRTEINAAYVYPDDNASVEADSVTLVTTPLMAIVTEAIETNDGDAVIMSISPQDGVTEARQYAIQWLNETSLPIALGAYDRAQFSDHWTPTKEGSAPYSMLTSCRNDDLHFNATCIAVQEATAKPHIQHLRVDPRDHADLVRYYTARQGSRFADADPVGDNAGGKSLLDRSGVGATATQTVAGERPTWESDQINHRPMIQFDGVDDNLLFTSTGSMTNWTVIMFVSPDTSTITSLLGSFGSTSGISVSTTSSTISLEPSLASRTWSHSSISGGAVLVFNSLGKLYVNGIEATLVDQNGFPDSVTATNFSTIGLDNLIYGDFDGLIGDVLIYDSVLSNSDINQQAGYVAFKYSETMTEI